MKSPTEAPNSHPFMMGEKILVSHIYIAAVGMFEHPDSKFIFCETIVGEGQNINEKARVYKNSEGQLHILYYPGKDNTKALTPKNTVEPLYDIRVLVDKILEQKYPADLIINAKKHFIVAECNKRTLRFLPSIIEVETDHYVYAKSCVYSIIVEDSKDENEYVQTGIKQAITLNKPGFEKTTLLPVYRNWQGVLDLWQCGHYVLQALYREIYTIKPPVELQIDDDIIALHGKYYICGLQKVRPDKLATPLYAFYERDYNF